MKKLRHLKHKDIDFVRWDKTINNSAFPSIFANSFFLNASSPGWEALVFGEYETVFPLTVKSKYTYKYLPQPLFAGQLGIFGKIDLEKEQIIYGYLLSHFKLIEIELNALHKLKAEGIGEKKTFVVDYTKKRVCNQNTKRNIKQAMALGLRVEQVSKKETLALSKNTLYPFLKNNLHISNSGLKTFTSIVESALKQDKLLTLKIVNKEHNVVGIGHFIYNENYALYLKGTNTDKKDNSGSMHLLLDFALEYFKQEGRLFDFGGGSRAGIAGFFKGLGGVELNYSTLKINKLPLLVKLLKGKTN